MTFEVCNMVLILEEGYEEPRNKYKNLIEKETWT